MLMSSRHVTCTVGCFRLFTLQHYGITIMRPFSAFRQKSLFIPGCVQGYSAQLVCLSVYVTFVVFTDCESCTRPISTNPDLRKRACMR